VDIDPYDIPKSRKLIGIRRIHHHEPCDRPGPPEPTFLNGDSVEH
jgi:hypothetical protein